MLSKRPSGWCSLQLPLPVRDCLLSLWCKWVVGRHSTFWTSAGSNAKAVFGSAANRSLGAADERALKVAVPSLLACALPLRGPSPPSVRAPSQAAAELPLLWRRAETA